MSSIFVVGASVAVLYFDVVVFLFVGCRSEVVSGIGSSSLTPALASGVNVVVVGSSFAVENRTFFCRTPVSSVPFTWFTSGC